MEFDVVVMARPAKLTPTGSGTLDFVDFAGSARIQHDDDGAYFMIELSTVELS